MWPPRWRRSTITGGRSAAAADDETALSIPSTIRGKFSISKGVHALLRDVDAAAAADLASQSPQSSSSSRRATVFHRVRAASSVLRAWRAAAGLPSPAAAPPPIRIVLYSTSLRVVRKTYDDCRSVRSILRGLRVAVDERDLSMDSSFLSELKDLLGIRLLVLPRIFIGGRYIGGADEIRQLSESGDLKRMVEGLLPEAPGACCEACGGVGFVLCRICSGSHRCFSEKSGGFRSCSACNENGLLRCPDCCTPPPR